MNYSKPIPGLRIFKKEPLMEDGYHIVLVNHRARAHVKSSQGRDPGAGPGWAPSLKFHIVLRMQYDPVFSVTNHMTAAQQKAHLFIVKLAQTVH